VEEYKATRKLCFMNSVMDTSDFNIRLPDAYQNSACFVIFDDHIDPCTCYWLWIISPH
jgi:hypothetical protein